MGGLVRKNISKLFYFHNWREGGGLSRFDISPNFLGFFWKASPRAKSAGARISAHGQKSKHLANRGTFVGGGFSLCTTSIKHD